MKDLTCFIGQKAFIEKDGKVLLLHDPQMGLDLPGGKVIEGELDLTRALQREVKEETNVVIQVGQPFYTWFFTIPLSSGHRSAGKKIFNVGYRCSYISGEIQLSPEHDWYKWVERNDYEKYLSEASFALALEAYFVIDN